MTVFFVFQSSTIQTSVNFSFSGELDQMGCFIFQGREAGTPNETMVVLYTELVDQCPGRQNLLYFFIFQKKCSFSPGWGFFDKKSRGWHLPKNLTLIYLLAPPQLNISRLPANHPLQNSASLAKNPSVSHPNLLCKLLGVFGLH